jgi:hypothetical protein
METRSRAIDKLFKRRDRIEMPDFQREEVWPDGKKRLLIDSVLKGWHLPKFYFRKVDDNTWECVDGQQRLVAIFEFFQNRLALGPEIAKRYGGGQTYSELKPDVSDAFDDFEIDVEEIEEATEDELEELFKRLQLGTPLNTAEKINAIQGELRDFCHEIADKPFFAKKIALKDTRYKHFEIVVRWAFIEARGVQPQMRYAQLESLLRENRTFSKESDTAKRLTATVDFLDKAFPDRCAVIRNRANTLSVCLLAGRVVNQGLTTEQHAKEFRAFIEQFFADLSREVEKGVMAADRELLRYQTAITSGSTSGESTTERSNVLINRLATFSPLFASLLGGPGATGEAARNLEEVAAAIREEVYRVNRGYAAKHGEDLFKMTTESATALATTIARPCRVPEQYGMFIDGLYFLIYEGSGACKRLPSPAPDFAMDVKFLRTDVRHDVDHGSESEVAKKRVRAAQIIEKYMGKKTIEECGPEELLSGQFRILRTMLAFLNGLGR